MDKSNFEKLVERMKEVNEIIKALDPAIREDAFKLLQSYVIGEKTTTPQEEDTGIEEASAEETKEGFFTRFTHDKPADNVILIAAYHYNLYGIAPISIEEVRQFADEVGITVSDRIDMTLFSAKRAGKKLFKRAGRAKFKPTVHGEQFIKETYQVSKGTKVKENNGEK